MEPAGTGTFRGTMVGVAITSGSVEDVWNYVTANSRIGAPRLVLPAVIAY